MCKTHGLHYVLWTRASAFHWARPFFWPIKAPLTNKQNATRKWTLDLVGRTASCFQGSCLEVSRCFGEQNTNSGHAAAPLPHAGGLGLRGQTGIFTDFYFLRGMFKLFARTDCINQTVVSRRHRLCLLEPERAL